MPANMTAWLAAHRTQAGIGAAGVVGAYALYKRSKSGSTTTPASTATTAAPTAAYDSTKLDQYNALASAISNLNDQIDAITASNPAQSVQAVPTSPTPAVGTGGLSSPGVPLITLPGFTNPVPGQAVANPGSQGYNVQTGNLQSYDMSGAGTTVGGLLLGPASAFSPPPGNPFWGGTPYVLEGGQLATRDASGI